MRIVFEIQVGKSAISPFDTLKDAVQSAFETGWSELAGFTVNKHWINDEWVVEKSEVIDQHVIAQYLKFCKPRPKAVIAQAKERTPKEGRTIIRL